MKKLLFFMFAMLVYPNLHAQKLQVRVDSLSASINWSNIKIENLNVKMENIEGSIEGLTKQVENLSYLVEAQKEVISQEQSAIENSMGAVNTLLAVFSLIITIGGIFLGWFINRKEKNVQALLNQVKTKKEEVEKLEKSTLKTKEEVEKLKKSTLKTKEEVEKLEASTLKTKDEVKKLEESTSKTKDEIVKLNDNINNDIEGLYDKLKKEETASLFKRLVDVPLDIGNIGTLLLARKVDTSNFKYLIVAYRNLKNLGVDEEHSSIRMTHQNKYLLQFFQHFCGQAISHSLVKDDLIRFFPIGFTCAFQSDVEYSTNSLVVCLNKDKSIENKIDILYAYIKALSESEHKEYCLPYEIVANNYNNEDDLIQLWKKLVANKIVNKQFGELLCDRLSSNESIVSDIKKDIEEVENNDKDEPDSK